MNNNKAQNNDTFLNGCTWLRTDFHLHTKADGEFQYTGEEARFISGYVEKLKKTKIKIGVITNHNKFGIDEFKALRKADGSAYCVIVSDLSLKLLICRKRSQSEPPFFAKVSIASR